MLAELYPRFHARYAALPVLGPYLDGFVRWLRREGYPDAAIRTRLRAAGRRLVPELVRDGVKGPEDLSAVTLLAYAPVPARTDAHLAAVVRSLARYFEEQGVLAPTPVTPTGVLLTRYRQYLEQVRGLACLSVANHASTVAQFLAFLGGGRAAERVGALQPSQIEAFIRAAARRRDRASLQHTVAHLRSFLRFLAASDLAPAGLENQIDTPRLYRQERLPRALSWKTVRALLRAVDRSTPEGKRDYAMLLLIATYGLRSCEVVSLTLDDVQWRSGRLHVPRSKIATALELPLTPQVGTALFDYLRHGRPPLPYREIFLRVRAPAGPLKPTAVTEVFQNWARRSRLPIAWQGPHCLRHSLAVHLLRQQTPLKVIGDLLGHRSAESTCVYLRLHVEDLRDVALNLPVPAAKEEQR